MRPGQNGPDQKSPGRRRRRVEAEVQPRPGGRHPAPGRPHEQPGLQQVRLVDVLDGVGLLADADGQG